MTWAGPLWKPSRTARLVSKWKARIAKRKMRTELVEAARKTWLSIRERIYKRDKGRCRVCGAFVFLAHVNPLRVAHVHHVVYRSAGGTDESSNLALLCFTCHDQEHRHIIGIVGNADICLSIELFDEETGRQRGFHQSPCPTS